MNPNSNAFRSVYEPTSVSAGVPLPAPVHRHGLVANDVHASGSLQSHNTFDGWLGF